MFQSFLNSVSELLSVTLQWFGAHPFITVGILTVIVIVWLHIPSKLEYCWQKGAITIHPFNVRNELPTKISGRFAVLSFCKNHGIKLALFPRIGRTLLEFFLALIGIPNPRKFGWESCFAAIEVYPFGHSRREYIAICIKHQMWPWKRSKTLRGLLDQNHGYLPELEPTTLWVSLINRLHSRS